jgi:cyclic pyranopterin phosphate synthase
MLQLQDSFGRTFKTLRVSLVNTCNLACAYCVDTSTKTSIHQNVLPPQKVLSTEQYINIIHQLNKILHFETVRLTGGEPTLYKQLIPLVKGVNALGISNIKMTSNGVLLENKAAQLKAAGLTAINISLDAVNEATSFKISQRHTIKKIINGIDKALEEGIAIKINCVVMKGFNDGHILELFEYCKTKNITVRFLELMQMGHLYNDFHQYFVSEKTILDNIALNYKLTPLLREEGATANYWVTNDGYKFGIVSNVSSPFCNDCNRLRLDSYGNIYGCLSDNTPINILECVEDEKELGAKIYQALLQKKTKFSGSKLSMLHIGG